MRVQQTQRRRRSYKTNKQRNSHVDETPSPRRQRNAKNYHLFHDHPASGEYIHQMMVYDSVRGSLHVHAGARERTHARTHARLTVCRCPGPARPATQRATAGRQHPQPSSLPTDAIATDTDNEPATPAHAAAAAGKHCKPAEKISSPEGRPVHTRVL